jgi:hypothetical protein
MTASKGWSLQRGIYQALANSSELGALLGGTRIYDDAPQVHDIIEAIKSTLPDQPLTLVDHDLVNLRHEFSEVAPGS